MPQESRLQFLRGLRSPDNPTAGSGMLFPKLQDWLQFRLDKEGRLSLFQSGTTNNQRLVAVSMLHHYINYLQGLPDDSGRLVALRDFPMYRLHERENLDPHPETQAISRILNDARALNDRLNPNFPVAGDRLVRFAEKKFYPWLVGKIQQGAKGVYPISLVLTANNEKTLNKKIEKILEDPTSKIMGRFSFLLSVKQTPELLQSPPDDQELSQRRRRKYKNTTHLPISYEDKFEKIDIQKEAIKTITVLQRDLRLP